MHVVCIARVDQLQEILCRVSANIHSFDVRWLADNLQEKLGINLHCVDAKDRFLTLLDGCTEPEAKRKIIGKTFIHVFQVLESYMICTAPHTICHQWP